MNASAFSFPQVKLVVVLDNAKKAVKKRKFFTAPFQGREKMRRMNKLSQNKAKLLYFGLPEGVQRYVERRSLFIA